MSQSNMVGSTLLPTGSITKNVQTERLQTDEIVLKGLPVTKLVHDLNDTFGNGLTEIPSVYAVIEKLREFDELYSQAEFLLDKFSNPWIISDPLVNPFFMDVNWKTDNVVLDSSRATINSILAELKILSSGFTSPGSYYIEINVEEISTTAVIHITNDKNELLYVIDSPGIHKFQFVVERPSAATLSFDIMQLPVGGYIILNSVHLYHVKTSLTRYLTFIRETSTTGESSYVSKQQLDAQITNALTMARTYTNEVNGNTLTTFSQHTQDTTSNLHKVTYSQAGAAKDVHTHTPAECNAAPAGHVHTGEDITLDGLNLTDIPKHVALTSGNPHNVTKDDIKLGNIPNNISSDPKNASSNSLATNKAVATVNDLLDQHISGINETLKHTLTKHDVGLGKVENYPPATLAEHVAGTLSDRTTTPEGLKYALSQWTNSGVDVSKMQPSTIHEFVLSSNSSKNIHIVPGKNYQINLYSPASTAIQKFHCNFINEAGEDIIGYRNTYTYTTTDSYMTNKSETSDYVNLCPSNYGVNYGVGKLSVDTTSMYVHGEYDGRIFDTGNNQFLNNGLMKLNMTGVFNRTDIQSFTNTCNTVKGLKLINGGSGDILVTIYEIVPMNSQPSLIVDATPVGMCMSTLGNNIAEGYGLIDGSEFSRTQYSKLFYYAQENNLVITNLEYVSLEATGTDIPYFSDGDGLSTFRIPKRSSAVLNDPWGLRIMKLKDVVIPKDAQLLFQLIVEEGN